MGVPGKTGWGWLRRGWSVFEELGECGEEVLAAFLVEGEGEGHGGLALEHVAGEEGISDAEEGLEFIG